MQPSFERWRIAGRASIVRTHIISNVHTQISLSLSLSLIIYIYIYIYNAAYTHAYDEDDVCINHGGLRRGDGFHPKASIISGEIFRTWFAGWIGMMQLLK